MSQQNSQQQGLSSSNTRSYDSENNLPLPSIREHLGEYLPPSHHPSSQGAPPGGSLNIIQESGNGTPLRSSARHPTGRSAEYRCTYVQCSFVADRPSALEVHERSHRSAADYHCTVCGKGFKTISNLNRHTKTHNSDSQFMPADPSNPSKSDFPGKKVIHFP